MQTLGTFFENIKIVVIRFQIIEKVIDTLLEADNRFVSLTTLEIITPFFKYSR